MGAEEDLRTEEQKIEVQRRALEYEQGKLPGAVKNRNTDKISKIFSLVDNAFSFIEDENRKAAIIQEEKAKLADTAETDLEKYTILHRAILTGNLDVFKFLLQQGANPDKTNYYGDAPIHIIASMPEVTLKMPEFSERLKLVKDFAEALMSRTPKMSKGGENYWASSLIANKMNRLEFRKPTRMEEEHGIHNPQLRINDIKDPEARQAKAEEIRLKKAELDKFREYLKMHENIAKLQRLGSLPKTPKGMLRPSQAAGHKVQSQILTNPHPSPMLKDKS